MKNQIMWNVYVEKNKINSQENYKYLFIFYVKYDKIVLLSLLKKQRDKLNNTYEKEKANNCCFLNL